MRKFSWLVGLLLLALAAGLSYFAGLTTSSSYPEMSSLNAGPRGTKLLFDALSGMPPLSVSRNYLPFGRWQPSSSTVLVLSLSSLVLNAASKEDLLEIETLVRANNRVVLCVPDDSDPGKFDAEKLPPIKTRWGIQILQKKDELALDYDSSWQPVSGLDEAVEKHFGSTGSVVVALHSDDLSNESLATDASYLAELPLLIGRHTAVVFDETHFGIEESGSIAGLARRYKLQGLIAGLLILAGLFIWNQSVSFPPSAQFESRRETQVLGADARKTFAGLIARHLTPQALVESCVAEWNRVKPQQRITTEVSGKIDPVASYRQLQESLPKRSSRT